MTQVLPAELWIQIIRELPSHYQRSCLPVSKLFHDISLQCVFTSINVRLGLARDFYIADEDRWCPQNNQEKAEADAAICRSCELLQHIVRSPWSGLALAVRNVSVRAYSYCGEPPPTELLNALDEALSVLRLRGFAWYGCHPMPRQRVFELLSTASCETMEDFILPAELTNHPPVLAFTHLKSLSFLNRYGTHYECRYEDESRLGSMKQTIMATSASLRSLSVFGEVFWNCHTHRLSSLVELTLVLLTDVEYLEAVFTHFPQLRSLTLLAGAAQYGDLAVILRRYYDALPLLTAFRLSCTTMGKDVAEAVAKFLGTKPLLERLELGYHWDMCTFEDAEPVLEILPRLPGLRAFGAELCGSSWMAPAPTPAHLLSLSQYIPRQLTALSLWVVLDSESTTTETDWIQFFRGLRSCRFLYISTDPVYPGMPGIEELKRTFFDHPPPSVELVGFNEDLRWVEREAETGLVTYSESWPLSRVYYRTVEDFGCEEWEWLLRKVDLRLL